MIEILRSEVQEKLGITVKNRGECQFLSDALLVEIGETVNYNTLRRFFGVDKKVRVQPSENTLNVLSKFLGYSSYNQFSQQIIKFGANHNRDEWYSVLNGNSSEAIVSYLNEKRMKGISFTNIFIRAIRELILFGRIADVDRVFKSESLRLESFSYSESVYVGNAIGILLRDVVLSEEKYVLLLKNERFVQSVLTIFVDYSNLNGGYGALVNLAESRGRSLSKNNYTFFRCLNYLRLYLMNKDPRINLDIDISIHEAHPILIGRVAAVIMLEQRSNVKEQRNTLAMLKERFHSEKLKRIDYFYEVKIISLILSDFDLMNSLEELQEEQHIRKQYQISHYQLSCLLKLLLSIRNEDENERSSLDAQIKPELWVKSYYDFFDLFYLIARFHSVKGGVEKRRFKAEYLRVSKKMNYPCFDEKFLLTYFD